MPTKKKVPTNALAVPVVHIVLSHRLGTANVIKKEIVGVYSDKEVAEEKAKTVKAMKGMTGSSIETYEVNK